MSIRTDVTAIACVGLVLCIGLCRALPEETDDWREDTPPDFNMSGNEMPEDAPTKPLKLTVKRMKVAGVFSLP